MDATDHCNADLSHKAGENGAGIMNDAKNKFDDTRDGSTSQPDTAANTLQNGGGSSRSDVDTEVDQAQSQINNAKESAKRDWDSPDSDVQTQVDDSSNVTRSVRNDARGNVQNSFTDSGGDNDFDGDQASNNLRARADEIGGRARSAGAGLRHNTQDAGAILGTPIDDTNRKLDGSPGNLQHEGDRVTDGTQEESKGFVDKVKDFFSGDKNS